MMLSLAESLMPGSQQWFLLGLLAATVAAVWVLGRRRRPLDGSPAQYRREIDSAVAEGQAVNRDLRELLVELEQWSRRINDQLDAKSAELQRTLGEADRRISAFRTLIDEVRGLAEQASASSGGGAVRPSPNRSEARNEPEQSPDTPSGGSLPKPEVDEIKAPSARPHEAQSVTDRSSSQKAPTPAPSSTYDERCRRIYALADEGLAPIQIALQLGQPVGEIELILNLRETASRRG